MVSNQLFTVGKFCTGLIMNVEGNELEQVLGAVNKSAYNTL